jgi:dihydrofolate reductase
VAEAEACGRVKPQIILVAAVAENGVIGRDNGLPWRLKSDMQYFRALTMGKPLVMGRKTWLSIGKPLKGRTNIVVTRDRGFAQAGVLLAHDIDSAMTAARGDALRRGANAIAVIGGTDIFRLTMPVADRLSLTLVHAKPDGDAYFPEIDPKAWRETERKAQPKGPDDDYGITFATYERVARHERAL